VLVVLVSMITDVYRETRTREHKGLNKLNIKVTIMSNNDNLCLLSQLYKNKCI